MITEYEKNYYVEGIKSGEIDFEDEVPGDCKKEWEIIEAGLSLDINYYKFLHKDTDWNRVGKVIFKQIADNLENYDYRANSIQEMVEQRRNDIDFIDEFLNAKMDKVNFKTVISGIELIGDICKTAREEGDFCSSIINVKPTIQKGLEVVNRLHEETVYRFDLIEIGEATDLCRKIVEENIRRYPSLNNENVNNKFLEK